MPAQGHIENEGAVYRRLAAMAEAGQQGVLVTVIATRLSTPRHEGSKMIVHPDGGLTGSIGGGKAEALVVQEAQRVLADGRCRRLDLDLAGGLGVCGGHMEVFLEPVVRGASFVVVGAGHVGRALLQVGAGLSFHFTLVDDRPEFLAPLAGGSVSLVEAAPAQLAALLKVDPRGAVLLASRSHELDGDYLAAVLQAEQQAGCRFAYLGVLGSRAKASRLRARMDALGPLQAARMETVQMPVGLDIGSETPGEIALSVLAEALAVLRGSAFLQDDQGRDLGVRLHRRRDQEQGS